MTDRGIQKLDELLAKEEIRSLALRYARSMDSTDAYELRKLWATARQAVPPWIDLGVVESSIIPSWSTRGHSQMRIMNHEIEIDGDKARGVVTSDALVELPTKLIYQNIRYFDEYEKSSTQVWVFSRRFHELVYGSQIQSNPWKQELASWPAHQVGSGGDGMSIHKFLHEGELASG